MLWYMIKLDSSMLAVPNSFKIKYGILINIWTNEIKK